MNKYRFFRLCIAVICILGLVGCGNDTALEYEIDVAKQQILADGNIYEYREEAGDVVFVYPNDVVITVGGNEDTTTISGDIQDVEGYLEPGTLYEIYNTAGPELPIASIVVILIGLLIVLLPKVFWYAAYGWFFGMEDNETAVRRTRICGVIIVFVGIVGFFVM